MPHPNEEILELIEAKYAIEFKHAKPVLSRPLPDTHTKLRAEIRFAISEYLTESERQDMQEEKQEVYEELHKTHMGLDYTSIGKL